LQGGALLQSAVVTCHLLLYVPGLTTNRLAGMAAFFFGNMAQSSLTQTGAFEVFYNGALVSCYYAAIMHAHHVHCCWSHLLYAL